MRAFAELLDQLSFQPRRNGKLKLLENYIKQTPDPDRGYALAALTGDLSLTLAKPALIRELIQQKVDPDLFAFSYDYVGDLSETVALLWPSSKEASDQILPTLGNIINTLENTPKKKIPDQLLIWLDQMPSTERWALLKLITGGMRVGVSAKLVKNALTNISSYNSVDIEDVYASQLPPFTELLQWAVNDAPRPKPVRALPFFPLMLAHPLQDEDRSAHKVKDFSFEWKWDGIRVQLQAENTEFGYEAKLYSRSGDDISRSFPDVLEKLIAEPHKFIGVMDGELLVIRDGIVAPFSDLQKRLNRKTVSKALRCSHPVGIRAYDIIKFQGEDIRSQTIEERQSLLQAFFQASNSSLFSFSRAVFPDNWDQANDMRCHPENYHDGSDAGAIEGLMVKRKHSAYKAGRAKGNWYKWKRDPHLIDAVLMYAQRGHGKRSSFYSDFTFGVWTDKDELTPVGKAYFGFTDLELVEIDKFVRNNTINRFGPVREVLHTREEGLVFEVAFEGLSASTRHKSGVAMRFPRIHRIRNDKKPGEADNLENLKRLLS